MRFLLLPLMMAVCGFSALAEDDYFPMHVGDEWTMEAVHVATRGQTSRETFSRRIEATVERPGKTYFRSRIIGTDKTLLRRKDEKAVYLMLDQMDGGIEEIEFFLPSKAGAEWNWGVGKRKRLVSVIARETVKVSGRSYENCYHCRSISRGGEVAEDSWQAPNVGTVQSIVMDTDGSKDFYTLKEFKPGK